MTAIQFCRSRFGFAVTAMVPDRSELIAFGSLELTAIRHKETPAQAGSNQR